MRLSQLGWYSLQAAIVAGVFVFNEEFNDEPVPPGAALLTGVIFAAVATVVLVAIGDLARRLVRFWRRVVGPRSVVERQDGADARLGDRDMTRR